jgi:hypothetical protein
MVSEKSLLTNIKINMKNDAFLVGSIPNVRYIGNIFKLLFLRDWMYTSSGILDETHFRFFTKKSIKRTFEELQFNIEVITGLYKIHVSFDSFQIFIKTLTLKFLSLIFGEDTQYIQFSFRLSKRN